MRRTVVWSFPCSSWKVLGTGPPKCCRIISRPQVETLAAGGHSPLSWRHQCGAACTTPSLEILWELWALLGCLVLPLCSALPPVPSQPVLSSHLPQNFPFLFSLSLVSSTFSLYSLSSRFIPGWQFGLDFTSAWSLRRMSECKGRLPCRGALLPGADVSCFIEITLLNLLPLFHCFLTCNMLFVFWCVQEKFWIIFGKNFLLEDFNSWHWYCIPPWVGGIDSSGIPPGLWQNRQDPASCWFVKWTGKESFSKLAKKYDLKYTLFP